MQNLPVARSALQAFRTEEELAAKADAQAVQARRRALWAADAGAKSMRLQQSALGAALARARAASGLALEPDSDDDAPLTQASAARRAQRHVEDVQRAHALVSGMAPLLQGDRISRQSSVSPPPVPRAPHAHALDAAVGTAVGTKSVHVQPSAYALRHAHGAVRASRAVRSTAMAATATAAKAAIAQQMVDGGTIHESDALRWARIAHALDERDEAREAVAVPAVAVPAVAVPAVAVPAVHPNSNSSSNSSSSS
jgi:hypothetical protein